MDPFPRQLITSRSSPSRSRLSSTGIGLHLGTTHLMTGDIMNQTSEDLTDAHIRTLQTITTVNMIHYQQNMIKHAYCYTVVFFVNILCESKKPSTKGSSNTCFVEKLTVLSDPSCSNPPVWWMWHPSWPLRPPKGQFDATDNGLDNWYMSIFMMHTLMVQFIMHQTLKV